MIKSEEREICGAQYQTSSLPARRAISVGSRLLKFIGPSIGKLGGAMKIEGDKIVDFEASAIPGAVQILIDKFGDGGSVVDLMLEILGTTTRVDPHTNKRQEVSKAAVFDTVYASNFAELFQALKFAMEVSLGDFFGGSGISRLWDRALAAADRISSQPVSSSD